VLPSYNCSLYHHSDQVESSVFNLAFYKGTVLSLFFHAALAIILSRVATELSLTGRAELSFSQWPQQSVPRQKKLSPRAVKKMEKIN